MYVGGRIQRDSYQIISRLGRGGEEDIVPVTRFRSISCYQCFSPNSRGDPILSLGTKGGASSISDDTFRP